MTCRATIWLLCDFEELILVCSTLVMMFLFLGATSIDMTLGCVLLSSTIRRVRSGCVSRLIEWLLVILESTLIARETSWFFVHDIVLLARLATFVSVVGILKLLQFAVHLVICRRFVSATCDCCRVVCRIRVSRRAWAPLVSRYLVCLSWWVDNLWSAWRVDCLLSDLLEHGQMLIGSWALAT